MPVFVFDAYGTLFDVHAAMAKHRSAAGPDADRLSELWRTKQLEYTWTLTLAGRYVDFWTLTELALDAFSDARAALRELKASGRQTAILSNGTPRMLEAAVEAAKLGAELDRVLSVDAIRMYKPRPEVYRLVTDAFHVAPAVIRFVSSNRWDVMGAVAFGFRAVWINRGGMPEEYADAPPTKVLQDLRGLVERI